MFPGADTRGIVCKHSEPLPHDPKIDAKVRQFVNDAQKGVFDPKVVWTPFVSAVGRRGVTAFLSQIGNVVRLDFRGADRGCRAAQRGYSYKIIGTKGTAGLTVEFNRQELIDGYAQFSP